MENVPKIAIKNVQIKGDGCFAELYIDGHLVRGVRGFELKVDANEVPILKLDLNALDYTIDGQILLWNKQMRQYMDIKLLDCEEESQTDSPSAE